MLPSSSDDVVSTSAMPSGGKIVTLRFRTGLPGDDTINDDLRGCAVLFSYTPITTGGFLSEGFFCRGGGGGSIGQASSASSEKMFSMSNYAWLETNAPSFCPDKIIFVPDKYTFLA